MPNPERKQKIVDAALNNLRNQDAIIAEDDERTARLDAIRQKTAKPTVPAVEVNPDGTLAAYDHKRPGNGESTPQGPVNPEDSQQ